MQRIFIIDNFMYEIIYDMFLSVNKNFLFIVVQ